MMCVFEWERAIVYILKSTRDGDHALCSYFLIESNPQPEIRTTYQGSNGNGNTILDFFKMLFQCFCSVVYFNN